MNSNSEIKANLLEKLKDDKYRRAFADQYVGTHLATQLYALREARGLTQTELSDKSGIAQPRISVLEDIDYHNYSIKTLKRVAAAYDIAFVGEFVSFKELVDMVVDQSPGDLAPPPFNESVSDQSEAAMTPQPTDLLGEQKPITPLRALFDAAQPPRNESATRAAVSHRDNIGEKTVNEHRPAGFDIVEAQMKETQRSPQAN